MTNIKLHFLRPRISKTSAAMMATPEPPRPSVCPDRDAAAQPRSPAAEAALAGAALMSIAVSASLDLSLTPVRLWAAALSPWRG